MRALLVLTLFLIAGAASAENSITEYAKACEAEVGPLPAFSCKTGVPVPITVNGNPVTEFKSHMECDRPALLPNGDESDGQCVPHSRILDLSTEKLQISAMCRQKMIRAPESTSYDEIDVIAHNPATGATCWFQAKAEVGAVIDGENVASPTEARDTKFWKSPEDVADDGCGNCHDNDPFMFSPFVGQVWGAVPVNPMGAYFHVGHKFGFGEWPTKTMNLRDNTCLGCHRIGIRETCGNLTDWMTGHKIPEGADAWARNFPATNAMPPEHGLTMPAWITVQKRSVDQIRSCCADPDQPQCQLTELPRY
ncbi:hypothetical protein [Actibacterium lipolyticum]|uniref:Cytochrome c-552/4 domain-containing protein n=1 Tax=Actibacterium lipolyticum TaxID=1524263 RepID=A0A238KNQ3_9RHOB|nr:hypothetical protein [Actibacterium lipolyticum]SMX44425.1 hypothetical protein COL8621_02553 [Actibacterium lipolyticum]